MYYTLFYSMSLFLASLLIGYQLSSSKFKKALMGGASIVLSIIIAGGNFVSGLGMGAILFAAILIMKMEQRKWPRLYITILTIYGIAFLFSVLVFLTRFRQSYQRKQAKCCRCILHGNRKELRVLIRIHQYRWNSDVDAS